MVWTGPGRVGWAQGRVVRAMEVWRGLGKGGEGHGGWREPGKGDEAHGGVVRAMEVCRGPGTGGECHGGVESSREG